MGNQHTSSRSAIQKSKLKLNQRLSFSPLFAKSTKGAKVFWPGCALLGMDPQVIDGVYAALKQMIPDLGFNTYCCGKPSLHVYSRRAFDQRMKWLKRKIEKLGIKEAYVACPNCKIMLEQYLGLKVTTIWEVLDQHYPDELLGIAAQEVWALHDPCPTRKDCDTQEAVRSILSKAGVDIREFPHNRANTRCCGNLNMLNVLNPPQSRTVLKNRLAEAPSGTPIASYCQGCVKTFRGMGGESRNIIELLFGKSSSCNWLNRYQNANKKR